MRLDIAVKQKRNLDIQNTTTTEKVNGAIYASYITAIEQQHQGLYASIVQSINQSLSAVAAAFLAATARPRQQLPPTEVALSLSWAGDFDHDKTRLFFPTRS